jgi:serine/threonine-protein kinase RsbW
MGVAHNLIGEVMAVVRSEQWNENDLFALELILEESLTNAVEHGNGLDKSKMVRFDCKLNHNRVYARIEDEGEGFDPRAVADPREPDNQMIESGRGVLLMTHFATKIRWNKRGNVVEIEKDRSER